MTEEKQSFWYRLFGGKLYSDYYKEERERRVLEYIIHRIGDGAHLRDVVQEEYVRRYVSRDEIDELLEDPRLIEAAHEKMQEDFSSGKLAPKPPPSAAQ